MKKMREYTYHYALKGKIKGNFKQQHVMDRMIGCALFVYNRLVALNTELFYLRQVKTYLKPVADRIAYIESVLTDAKHLKNSAPFLSDI